MRRLIGIFIVVIFIITAAVDSYAQISSAAVLFLRIAAGARAAGMGEAYVAISDDATATHWNPAGLGQYPLSDKWDQIVIPADLQPLDDIALFRGEGPETDYRKFDVWALSQKGLIRYSKGNWIQEDVLSAKPDQTVESILRQYTGLVGESAEKKIPDLLKRVAQANNAFPREKLDTLEGLVMGGVAEGYTSREELQNNFNILKGAYDQCLVDSQMVKNSFDLAQKALKDSVINESEADKILVAVEKAKSKYLPPELRIPYDINLAGQLNAVAAGEKYLWVGTDSGLFRYDGERWQSFGVGEGLPNAPIKNIYLAKDAVFLYTDSGLATYVSGKITYFGLEQGLPRRPISAVAAIDNKKAWAVVDNDLYRYDGSVWKNYAESKDTAFADAEKVYESMKIYGTPSEREMYISKYILINSDITPISVAKDTIVLPDSAASMASALDSINMVTPTPTPRKRSGDSASVKDSTAAMSMGKITRVPYTAGFGSQVKVLAVDNSGMLWVGTEFGILRFSGRGWKQFGYRNLTVEKETSVFDLALSKVKGDSTRAERLAKNIKSVNNLESDIIPAGQTIRLYSNPAGGYVNDINAANKKVYFATASGVILFDGVWGMYNSRNLGKRNCASIRSDGGNLWFISRDKIEINAAPRAEITLMHVNWLPELASDIYYEFLGYVHNVEGWGTIGANITFLSYGRIMRTGESGQEEGEFSAFDFAFTLSYGVGLTSSLSGGISTKVIYSHLSPIGAGREKGSGTSTGLALDLGLLYKVDPRMTLGFALTNLGPDMSYIDVAQADPLPRNLAVGFAWKMIQSSYNEVLFTIEANKSLAKREKTILEDFRDVIANPQSELKGFLFNPFTLGGLSNEFKGVILNGGIEYKYGSFFAIRAGYVHDEAGAVKTPTLGVGLAYSVFRFDFAYIPSSKDVPLANTMRFSLSTGW